MQLHPLVRRSTLAVAALGLSLQAENRLPETVVTATRTPTAISQVGKSIEVVTRAEVEQSQQTTLLEVLRTVPGVTIARNGRYGAASVFLRGAESYQTKILINGSAIADVTGTQHNPTSLAYVDLNNVERIEIVKGPQTVLYGSDAIGGVINVITKRGGGELSGSVRAEVGEHEYGRLGGGLSGGNDQVSWSLAGSLATEEGISALNLPGQLDNDDYQQAAIDARLGVELTEVFSLNLAANYLDVDYEYDSEFGGSPLQEGANVQGVYRGELAWHEADENWSGKAGVSYLDTDRRIAGPGLFDTSTYLGEIVRIDGQHTHKLHDLLQLTIGGNHEEQKSDGQGFAVVAETSLTEFFVQNQMQLHERVTLTAGLRWLDHEAFGNQATWQVDVAVTSTDKKSRFHASIGSGYRAPSLYELFDGFSGTPSLQPEESLGFDFGMDHQLTESISLGATYFHNEVENLIIFDFGTFTYANVRESVQAGVETYVVWDPTDEVKLRGSYVYLDAEDRDRDFDLARRPQHAISLSANWQASARLNLDGEMVYAGDRYSDPDNTRQLAAYAVVNLAASWQASEHIQLFARAANVFDEDYELVADYNSYGRTFYAGLELRF